MNGFKRYQWMTAGFVVLAVFAVGCASTSNIANKATFGLVGGADDPAKAEQKAQEREAKQAAKEQKKAEKQARKEAEGDRSLLSRATFGLAGDDSDAESQRKAAEKERKRAEEEQRKAERKAAKEEKERLEREAKAQRKAEKQAEKDAKAERSLLSRATFGLAGTESEEERQQKEAEEARKREEEAQRKAEREAEKEAKREENSERSLLNKATFGLAGTETEEERQQREAEEAQKRAEKEAEQERERAEKEQKRAENAERSTLNRLTFGLAGTESEEERQQREAEEARKREEEEQRRAEREAEKAAEREANAERSLLNKATFGLAGTETEEERQQREAEEARKREEKRQAELAKQEENANKTWLNRTTGGLLGEDYSDDALVEMAETNPEALTPEQLEKAEERKQAIADHQAKQRIESFADPEARKLASFPFNTEVISRVTPRGNPLSTATTETYSRADYGIADVGDVRIAVRGQTFNGDPRRSRLIVASNDRGPAEGSLGVGNQRLAYQYERGTTVATFGSIEFTLSDSQLSIGGVTVPVGQGRKLVVVDGGNAETYDID